MSRHVAVALCTPLLWMLILPLEGRTEDRWLSVHSKNFNLAGNAGEKDIRKVATQLEQFRDVFARLFNLRNLHASVPTTVLVFKSDGSFRPFKPLYLGKPANVSGYFHAGLDANYIVLTSEFRETNPYAVIFHEYVHALTNDNTRQWPLWFREGIAEFYSSFQVAAGDKEVKLGMPISSHVYLLREKKFLPLPELFAVDHGSPHYNERQKQGVFYAQSWAFVHYLMLGNNGKRQPQFTRYLELLASGRPVDESFRQSFQVDYKILEKELQEYIRRDAYPVRLVKLAQRLEIDRSMNGLPLSDAESQFYLGDLLLHQQRFDEAEKLLKRSAELSSSLAPAFASLGALYIRQQRWDEAKQFLEKAVAADSKNHLAHFNYAQLLGRGTDEGNRLASILDPQVAQTIRRELRRTIELAPSFVEAYRWLAYVGLSTGEELEDAVQTVTKAHAIFPGREELAFDLGQLHLRLQDYDAAKKMLSPIAQNSADPGRRHQAEAILLQLQAFQENSALIEVARQEANASREPETQVVPDSSEKPPAVRRQPEVKQAAPQSTLEMNRPKGEKAAGVLLRVDCLEKGIVFVIKGSQRTLRLYSAEPEKILLSTEKQESLGTISMSCGPQPLSAVVALFKASAAKQSEYDGELLAVTFVGQK